MSWFRRGSSDEQLGFDFAPARPQRRRVGKSISFTTRGGERVSFVLTGARDATRRKPNAYARFVQRRMREMHPRTRAEAVAYMKIIAREWKSR